MKLIHLLIFPVILLGCSLHSTTLPTPSSPVHITPTYSLSHPPPVTTHLPSPEIILQPTLVPQQAENVMRALLINAEEDCLAPCFWGITPGQTSFDEAKQIFTYLGLHSAIASAENNRQVYYPNYSFDNGLSVNLSVVIYDNIVESVEVFIELENFSAREAQERLAYSPEVLIHRYGTPSRVEFFIGMVDTPHSLHSMVMYFDTVDLIVEYSNEKDSADFLVCPLTDQQNIWVRLWFGEEPLYPPLPLVALDEATSMTLNEFSNLMMDNPEDACIDLKPYYSNH